MREIWFRGKRIDNSEWIEGYVLKLGKESFSDPERYGIAVRGGIPLIGSGVCYNLKIDEVDPETVGQYTGLTDKNGKRIFEGDIVKTDKFSEPNKQYIIKYDLQFGAFIGQDRYNLYFVTFDGDSGEFEVIGNIHDNPELLEK